MVNGEWHYVKRMFLSTEAQIIVYYGVQRFSFGIRDFATPKAEALNSKKS